MPARQSTPRPWAAIAAVTALTLPLGSIYAFSVFLKPIEAELGVSRSALSFVFGLATIGFTVGVNLAPLIYRLASPAVLIMSWTVAASLGIVLAALAPGMPLLLLGYGVVFGVAGGAIYIILQQAVNLLVRTRTGLLNGYVIALYPMGAMIAAPLFGWSNTAFGYRVTLIDLSGALLLTGFASTWLTVYAGSTLPSRANAEQDASAERHPAIAARLCAVFFFAAAAGLTVLSQAAGIIAAYGGAMEMALWATTGITAAIAGARISGGWLVDQFPIPFVAASAHTIALMGTIILSIWLSARTAGVALGMIGIGYGFVSGSTAAAIAIYWPKTMYGKIAGKIYIAWCVAAVTLPVLAGYLFDLTGGYRTTVLIAGGGNCMGVIIALGLPRRRSDQAHDAVMRSTA